MAENKKPFVEWEVKGVEYKLKLTTSEIVSMEEKLNHNLLDILNAGIPPLKLMIMIIHSALKKFNHGIKLQDVNGIIDDYFDEGGSQLELLTDIIMPVFTVSGFFPPEMSEKMEEDLTMAKTKMGE